MTPPLGAGEMATVSIFSICFTFGILLWLCDTLATIREPKDGYTKVCLWMCSTCYIPFIFLRFLMIGPFDGFPISCNGIAIFANLVYMALIGSYDIMTSLRKDYWKNHPIHPSVYKLHLFVILYVVCLGYPLLVLMEGGALEIPEGATNRTVCLETHGFVWLYIAAPIFFLALPAAMCYRIYTQCKGAVYVNKLYMDVVFHVLMVGVSCVFGLWVTLSGASTEYKIIRIRLDVAIATILQITTRYYCRDWVPSCQSRASVHRNIVHRMSSQSCDTDLGDI